MYVCNHDSLFCSVGSLGHACDTVVQISHPVPEGKAPGTGHM